MSSALYGEGSWRGRCCTWSRSRPRTGLPATRAERFARARFCRKTCPTMAFPATRLRRMRKTGALRGLVRETELSVEHLVYPLFVTHGSDRREPVAVDAGNRAADDLPPRGGGEGRSPRSESPQCCCSAFPSDKDEAASGAYDPEGIVQLAVRALKQAEPSLVVITDVCLCEYMSHGHCGVVREDGEVDNDVTLELLAKTAISHAEAGADVVAPSDMMDGRVGAIRSQLDTEGHSDLPIIAYSAKFASSFYGPFREAAESAPAFGDRRGYQMDPGQRARGGARGDDRRRGGSRRRDGEAGAALPRRDRARARGGARPGRRLQRLGRVRGAEGGGRARLDRRARSGARDPHRDPARRRRHRRSPTTPRRWPSGSRERGRTRDPQAPRARRRALPCRSTRPTSNC